ncbi:hypothetical protein ACRALDRAFT_1070005 [Sodiomyces alcalophilus JCM 7366]|uniref:uncharacterized protein n=1 Tax=Sodiomyces alcalophilus JCM 7366 TaxID=591952 RepID=UPI0039B67894
MGSSPPSSRPHILFYFIPGNPGYIDYYTEFLASLQKRVTPWSDGHIHVHGRDLAGFRDDAHAAFTAENPPYDVEGQIRVVTQYIASLRRTPGGAISEPSEKSSAPPYDLVVLAGHSVGAYIALEVFHRNQHHHHRVDPTSGEQPLLPRLHAGILLFPTVTHIARSRAGRRLARLAAWPPFVFSLVLLLARTALLFLPAWFLRLFCARVMGFSPRAARVTVDDFLKSRGGVWQALHLGRDEMRVIAEEKWDEALWDVVPPPVGSPSLFFPSSSSSSDSPRRASPKFFFLFGHNDHWVADDSRDRFIRAREKHVQNGAARVEIDRTGLPHAFCTTAKNSEAVASRTAEWLREIWDAVVPGN